MQKILVLSDIHFPQTDAMKVRSIIKKEETDVDKIIFLGDTVLRDENVDKFLELIHGSVTTNKELIFIRGDEDSKLLPCVSFLELNLGETRFLFMHGREFNIGSEELTHKMASMLYKINGKLPALAYALVARLRRINRAYLILGHAHVLVKFRRLKVVCSGSLTFERNIYNDRGYVVIESTSDGPKIILNYAE